MWQIVYKEPKSIIFVLLVALLNTRLPLASQTQSPAPNSYDWSESEAAQTNKWMLQKRYNVSFLQRRWKWHTTNIWNNKPVDHH